MAMDRTTATLRTTVTQRIIGTHRRLIMEAMCRIIGATIARAPIMYPTLMVVITQGIVTTLIATIGDHSLVALMIID